MKTTGCIYRLEFPSGKSYIGQTTWSAEIRLRVHLQDARKGSKCIVHYAIRKYGKPKLFVLEENVPIEMLNDREIYHIKNWATLSPYGYNLTGGGEGLKNPSRNTIIKCSIRSKKLWGDSEYRQKIMHQRNEFMYKPEYREKQSAIAKSKWNSEYREKMSAAVGCRVSVEGFGEFRSAHIAFVELKLPLRPFDPFKHFRMKLKAAGRLAFIYEGRSYVFSTIPKKELK